MPTESPYDGRARLLAIALIAWLEFLQNGLLNFASSQVMGGIGAGPEEFSLAAMAYALFAILALFNHQWCVERFGSRRHLQASLLLFGLGALIAGGAGSHHAFIIGRAVQGLGGAAFFTAARLEVAQLPPDKRGLGLVAFGQALLLGSALGPLLGGWLLQAYGWRALCWGMLPFLPPAWWAAGRLPLRPPAPRPAHYPSAAFVLLLATAFLLQWLIQQTPYQLFAHQAWLLAAAAAALACYFAFLAQHRRHASDRRRWRLLRRPGYRMGLLGYSCCYLLVSANSYILPTLAVQALGFDLPTSGLLLSVSFLAGMLFALGYAKLLLRGMAPTLRQTLLASCVLLTAYGWLMSGVNGEATLGRLAAILLLNGGFMSLFIMAVAQGTFRAIAPAAFGRAYQTKNIVRQVSISAGVALAGVFMQARNALHYNRLAERFSWDAQQFQDALRLLREQLPHLSDNQRLGVLAGELARQTALMSCLDFFRLEMWIALVLAGCLIALRASD
ncbi:MFS transporter [Chromobacterium paludis]|uniref:Multidrug efflux MFS transporter n=1 Tax=Chromobacterium paludis TaxID=2605945 RepID=A0A5C1DE88_9NEIS|nr:MFS transporter [Chromobacterium paludis]QEL54259.1 multidrug efflux MFS transporter [Chromobacterium paludis]